MTAEQEVDYILHDCFFAVGQTVATHKQVDFDAVVWWRERYREKFLHALTHLGNSWARDRRRVVAVGRYLGERAVHHAGDEPTIDIRCAALASADVESGCQMNAEREAMLPPACVHGG
jgi:hypothetical protein